MHDPAYCFSRCANTEGMLNVMHDRAEEPATWGKDLRHRRLELRLRQDELAALAGVSTRFVHSLEQSKPTARLDKVLAVLRQLGLDLVLAPGSGVLRSEEG
jgi:HTH-type transcriptional regulator / antitoxin HipB